MLCRFGFPKRDKHLSQGDSPIIGGDSLVPVGTKTGRFEPMNGPFGQIFVLKTSAAQNDPFFADPFGDSDNDLGERIVESGRDPSDRDTPFPIIKNPRYHGLPINDS